MARKGPNRNSGFIRNEEVCRGITKGSGRVGISSALGGSVSANAMTLTYYINAHGLAVHPAIGGNFGI